MNEKFILAKHIKDFIFLLDNILINYPKKHYELRNRLLYDSYNLLELVYEANYTGSDTRKNLQIKAMMKINILDFYLEDSFKKKIISEKQSLNLSNKLLNINKMLYKWMNDGKC